MGLAIYHIFILALLYGFLGIPPVEAFVASNVVSPPPVFHAAFRSAHQICIRPPFPGVGLGLPNTLTSTLASPVLTLAGGLASNIEVVATQDELVRRSPRDQSTPIPLSSLVNNGSQVTTCHDRRYVHSLRLMPPTKFLHAVDKKVQHEVKGLGHLLIPDGLGKGKVRRVATWYTVPLHSGLRSFLLVKKSHAAPRISRRTILVPAVNPK